MATSPNRAAAAKSTSDDDGELQVVPPSVLEVATLVAAARLDTGIEAREFRDMLEELIEAVRHDERMRIQAAPTVKAKRVVKWLTADDAAKIRERARVAKGGRSKLPQGWKAAIAAEFGYTTGQIDQAVYHQGV